MPWTLSGLGEPAAIFDDGVRALIAELIRSAPVSGGVLSADVDGETSTLAFGRRGPGGVAVMPDDRFEIGSISKTAAALAAARLETEGVWSLDDPVRGILPWLRLPEGASEPTLRHLLSHTAGWIAGNSATPGEIAQALSLPASRAVTAPGERFHYSNVGYVVLGLAMAAASGEPYPRLLRRLVLDPLGLPGALASITGAERAELCPGTVPLRDDAPWGPGDPLAAQTWVEPAGADGNIGASAVELARFARALADPQSCPGESWLPAAVRALATPTAPEGEEILRLGRHLAVAEARYGLGANVERTGLGTLLTHGGGMIGYSAFMIAHPGRRISIGVVLSSPGERPLAELLARELHAAALGPVPGILPGVPQPVASALPERAPLDAGAGAYAALTGHYRSYTPWCPHYEIGVGRDADGAERLILRAYSGVEAPTEDTPLVPIDGSEGRRFRVGADPRVPERLEFRDIIGGAAQTLDIDGCVYARVTGR